MNVEFLNILKPFASKWIELENIILSKVSQTQNHMFSLICHFRPKTNAVILLAMGHTLWEEHVQEE
jgi:hypothetical protein